MRKPQKTVIADAQAGNVTQTSIIKRLVMRHAEGNVSLHKGQFLTQSDADSIVERALSRDFSALRK